MFRFGIVVLLAMFVSICSSAPYQNNYGQRNELDQEQKMKRYTNTRESKKDIFISRGWGAGGMPFSVLYMNPSFSSSKAPATVPTKFNRPAHHLPKNKGLPQVRTAMRQKLISRSPHSVIPQLFVSYGWGPLGKK